MLTTDIIASRSNETADYTLYSAAVGELHAYIFVICEREQAAIEMVGGELDDAIELLERISRGGLCSEHLFDVADDYRQALIRQTYSI